MITKLALAGILLLGMIVAYPGVRVFAYSGGSVVAQGAVTPTPPPVIPAWVLGGGAFYGGQPGGTYNDVDPGPSPDQRLFAGVLDAGQIPDATLETNCPGDGLGTSNASNCNPYLYINMLDLLCDQTVSSNAYAAMNDGYHETAFLHGYASPSPTPTASAGPRLSNPGSCPSPNVSPTLTPNPYPSAGYYMNPDDTGGTGFLWWLAQHVWTTTVFPPPFGIYEDHFAVTGYPCFFSYEYGGQACNEPGTSNSPAPVDWETALGAFESNAESNCGTTCFSFVGNGLTLGSGADTPGCSTIVGGNCFAPPEAGVVDDMDSLDNVCANADSTGHLRAMAAEEIVFLKGSTTSGTTVYANPQTIVYMINTMSHIVNYKSGPCENLVAIDVEAAGGSFYPLPSYTPGSVSAGIPVRTEATALRFLVPDTLSLVPDRMQPFYFTIGGTDNHWSSTSNMCASPPYCEVPYMFEETLVPQGPEVSVGPFAWNGSTQTVGDGCPTPNPGDSGGAVDLMVSCVTGTGDPASEGAAVFLQEYSHLYINGNDYGPVAVLLNTASATSVDVSSSWFCSTCDPLTSFHYKLRLSGGELASVAYGGSAGSPIAMLCTQATFCNGNDTVAGNTTLLTGAPITIGPHSGVILLAKN